MLQRALPEESSSRVARRRLPLLPAIRGPGPFTLSVDLVDAKTGERFGAITIPFVAE